VNGAGVVGAPACAARASQLGRSLLSDNHNSLQLQRAVEIITACHRRASPACVISCCHAAALGARHAQALSSFACSEHIVNIVDSWCAVKVNLEDF
jgi:hypothetical protein